MLQCNNRLARARRRCGEAHGKSVTIQRMADMLRCDIPAENLRSSCLDHAHQKWKQPARGRLLLW
jgi:hypothetical protein